MDSKRGNSFCKARSNGKDGKQMLDRVPVKNEAVVWRELHGEAVLLNPGNGKYYGLNAVGLSMWEKVDGVRTLQEIAALLLDEYAVERASLEQDLLEWAGRMEENTLLSFAD